MVTLKLKRHFKVEYDCFPDLLNPKKIDDLMIMHLRFVDKSRQPTYLESNAGQHQHDQHKW